MSLRETSKIILGEMRFNLYEVMLNIKKRFNPCKMSLHKIKFNPHEMANLIWDDKKVIYMPLFLHKMLISYLYFVRATSGNLIMQNRICHAK